MARFGQGFTRRRSQQAERTITQAPTRPPRRSRRRDPDDQQGWGDVPSSALEHPYIRLLQAMAFALLIFFGLNQVGLLNRGDVTLSTTRIVGQDPVSASASVARESHGGGAETVIIAGTSALADGVVATGLAGAMDAPILLNDVDQLSPQILDVLRELDTERVILIGGTSALNEIVAATLQNDLRIEVTRVAGASRFDTAAQVADLFAKEADPAMIDGRRSALVVPAENVPLGLEAGSLAASRDGPMPVLISQSGRLPSPILDLIDRMAIEQLFVVAGGPEDGGSVSDDFNGPVRVIQGAAGAANMTLNARAFRPPRVVMVPGGDQARTLIAGPLAAREAGVILTAQEALPWLQENCGTIDELFVIGEPDVIPDQQIATAEQAATNCPDE